MERERGGGGGSCFVHAAVTEPYKIVFALNVQL